MNYLAHLHLADVSNSHALGNVLGDFVKGTELNHFPPELQAGIRLHRQIDRYTDQHPHAAKARELFPDELRRYAGICLDLFWDYFLSCHWDRFHPLSKTEFVQQQYQLLESQLEYLQVLNARLEEVLPRMIRYDWLNAYSDIDNIGMALDRIGQRLRRPVALGASLEILMEHEQLLENDFLDLYPDVIGFAGRKQIELLRAAVSA